MAKSSITFFTAGDNKSKASYKAVHKMDDVDQVYTRCVVSEPLSGDGAVWIVYSADTFGCDGTGVGKSHVVLPNEAGKLVTCGFSIKSAQYFNITQPCIALFEHFDYRGNMLPTDKGIEDITPQFPEDTVAGLSSCIALSGEWELHTKPAYYGSSWPVDATLKMQMMPSFNAERNDKCESVKMVRACK